MKILMHCVYFPPEVGGLESHIHFLCRGLVERGHQVDVVTSRSQPGLAAREVVDGITVWRTSLWARNTLGWATHAAGSMPRMATLAQSADILHAQDIAAVLPCMVAKSVRGAPLVTTYHTSHFLTRAEVPFWRSIFRRYLEAANHNFAASTEIARVATQIAPKVHVEALTNGVETSVFRPVHPTLPPPAPGRRRVVVPRRLFPKNGVEYFVRALPLVVREGIDLEAIVVGDGPEKAELERLADELGVADRIDFLGSRPHADMPGLLSSAEVAIFPSLMEATSVGALESMACGLPVAASRVGGLPEIVDDGVGRLFEPRDPQGLALALSALLEGGALKSLGAEGRRRVVERWSNDRLVARHLEVYDGLLSRRREA